MRKKFSCLIIWTFFSSSCQAPRTTYPDRDWQPVEAVDPEWSASKLQEAHQFYEESGSDAVVAIFRGKLLISWGDVKKKYNAHSIRKSFLNALMGVYWGKGKIKLDKTLAKLDIDDVPSLSPEEKKATVEDLLRSRSGIYHAAAYETPQAKKSRPLRSSHLPGEFYYYNNWDFNTLLSIFEQETGAQFFTEFHQKIAVPLGMDFQPSDGEYYFEKQHSVHPAYPMRISALDMARFGLLYLNVGKWKDQQIIPVEWVRKETTSYSKGARGNGVGYKWQMSSEGALGRLGSYYTTGYRGHRLIVVPGAELIYVHRVNTDVQGRSVSGYRIEKLLKLILAANRNIESQLASGSTH